MVSLNLGKVQASYGSRSAGSNLQVQGALWVLDWSSAHELDDRSRHGLVSLIAPCKSYSGKETFLSLTLSLGRPRNLTDPSIAVVL